MNFRIDKGALRPARKTIAGHLRADAYITRTGVFTYLNPDGTLRREYRPPEEVFSEDSLESFSMIPVTDDHPSEYVTPDNASQYIRGTSGERVTQDGTHVAATIVVTDAGLIAKMESGKVEVSCGYLCDLDPVSGTTPEGEVYDVIQRNIRGNHIAVVDRGRAGPSARVRMDASYMTDGVESTPVITPPHEGFSMTLEEALKKLGEVEARCDAATATIAKLEGERDSAVAKATAAEKARTDAVTAGEAALTKLAVQIRADVEDRVNTEAKAKAILGDAFDASLDARAMKVAVIKQVCKVDVADDKVDAYVQARFDGACEQFDAGQESTARVGEAVSPSNSARADANDETAAHDKLKAAIAAAWETK